MAQYVVLLFTAEQMLRVKCCGMGVESADEEENPRGAVFHPLLQLYNS
jgi:hypothetical protein